MTDRFSVRRRVDAIGDDELAVAPLVDHNESALPFLGIGDSSVYLLALRREQFDRFYLGNGVPVKPPI